MKQPDIIEVTLAVTRILDDLKIDYYVGGSLASSAFGFARATMDVDLVADIKTWHVSRIVEELERSLYIDKVQGESLDKPYLELWAGKLGVEGLLAKIYQDSGVEEK